MFCGCCVAFPRKIREKFPEKLRGLFCCADGGGGHGGGADRRRSSRRITAAGPPAESPAGLWWFFCWWCCWCSWRRRSRRGSRPAGLCCLWWCCWCSWRRRSQRGSRPAGCRRFSRHGAGGPSADHRRGGHGAGLRHDADGAPFLLLSPAVRRRSRQRRQGFMRAVCFSLDIAF